MRKSAKLRERDVDPAYLRSVLSYDPETGTLRWKSRVADQFVASVRRSSAHLCANWNSKHADMDAGSVTAKGYMAVRLCGMLFMAHRVAWAIHTGAWPEDEVDHQDGDTTNMRFANLRSVVHRENMRNRKIGSRNTSGIMGVRLTRFGTWQAYVTHKGKQHSKTFLSKAHAIVWRQETTSLFSFHPNHGRTA